MPPQHDTPAVNRRRRQAEAEDAYYELSHHEDDLINQRLTWLIASQSLLFAGYAVLLTAEREKVEASKHLLDALAKWLPLLGVGLAALAFIGVLAAVVASTILKVRYKRPTFGVHWSTTWAGWVVALLFPVLFAAAWLLAAN